MGLFDKKYCDICGERIRFLGNRKLEDGNLCKDCEAKLSPWFSDRRRSTVQDIRDQLAYREENREKAAAFRASRTLGEGNLLAIDEENQQFVIRRGGQSMSENPDVIALKDVSGCEIDVEHSKTEEKTRDKDNKPVSYDPPRYTHSYRFYLTVRVNHPWFDDMRFRVNKNNVEIKTGIPDENTPAQVLGSLIGLNIPKPVKTEPDTEHDEAYRKYAALAEEMRRAILQLPDENEAAETPAEEPAAAAPEKVACPFCSAVAVPDANGCCPYCGEKVI